MVAEPVYKITFWLSKTNLFPPIRVAGLPMADQQIPGNNKVQEKNSRLGTNLTDGFSA